MKSKEKFINAYEIYYKDMLNSNINANHRAISEKKNKEVLEKDTFKNKTNHFNPS
ncbi:hypothetical protein R9X47_05830 [Wukongibacter baidiensis]|uniref:hypothetical protein n=1 Tax=Wukongibacter baidiensis TaxID=1723361 RepID=UPI003D7FCB6C